MRGLKFVLATWGFVLALMAGCYGLVWAFTHCPPWLLFGTLFLAVSALLWRSVENE